MAVGYAAFRVRFRALLVDWGILLGVFFIGGVAAAVLFEESPAGRVGAFVVIVALMASYEPIMLARYAGTIGHRSANIRVKDVRNHGNLPLWRAIIRALTKHFFGWFSLLFMFLTHRAQSLHDLAARSEVVIHDPRRAHPVDYFVPTPELADLRRSSPLRRVIFIALYALAFMIALVLWLGVYVSAECIQLQICEPRERQMMRIFDLAFVVGIGTLIVLGWKGHLPGARSRRQSAGG